jgi:hypothetical protein
LKNVKEIPWDIIINGAAAPKAKPEAVFAQ